MNDSKEVILPFDEVYLGHSTEIGGGHLETPRDVARARDEEEGLLLSPEAEKFVKLIVIHGMLPSEAFVQSFSKEDEFGNLISTPDMPAYQARQLLKIPEVRQAIEELRAEVRQWCKTEVEEVEMSLRRIMLDPSAKHSDKIAAAKNLSALKGFDAQPELMPGASIVISLPFSPNQLGQRPTVIEHEPLDIAVKT